MDMSDVKMTKRSGRMEEGRIGEWKKKAGDEVKQGDVLAEVESDKATFDLEEETAGVLSILVEQGVPAKIGAPIARIGDASAAPPKEKEKAPPAGAKPKEPEAPAQGVDAKTEAQEPVAEEPDERAPEAPSTDGQADGAVKASPLAKRLAAEMGVDLASLKGSGPEGRIVKEDVLAAGGTSRPAERRRAGRAQGAFPDAPPRAPGPDGEVVEPTRRQAAIARRMAEAKSTVPEFTVPVEARDRRLRLRHAPRDGRL